MQLYREFWMKHMIELFDRVRGLHQENYWLLQALMPPLLSGKTLGVILNVFPLWRYLDSSL